MRLTGLSYKTANWELEEVEFEQVSLVVGKNATGKSKTLSAINLLYEIICQKTETYSVGEWDVILNHNGDEYKYTFKFYREEDEDPWVESEYMTINGGVVFSRDNNGNVKIRNRMSGNWELSNPPFSKLVIHALRDIKKYPFIETVVNWAELSYGFRFGNIYPKFRVENREYSLLSKVEDIFSLYNGLSIGENDKILDELQSVGFPLEKIKISEEAGFFIGKFIEKDVIRNIPHQYLSQGMFRSFFILVFVEYLTRKKSTATIIIDDLCEGLDYERATKLGRLLFDKCLANNIQLIATSNDMFLMDVVDLKYWNVLQRNGQVVTAINAKNHPGLFEDFKFTGLSNFDFFASDYIAQNL